jgi:glycine cleavage system regulatory protein
MNVPLVMTVIGHDRPGLVGMLSDAVASHDGNWLESRMCHLGGEFAGILRIHLPQDRKLGLIQRLQALQREGLTIVIQPDQLAAAPAAAVSATLSLVGQDRPGIVRQISVALARYGVNVEELTTECASAPMSGEILFKAEIRLHIPVACPVDRLRLELEKIAADLMVDVNFTPAGVVSRE